MAIKIQSTADVSAKHGIKVLVYGDAGVGKTVLCSTAPAPIILSAESGLLSLRRANLPFIAINTYKDMEEAYLWATNSKETAKYQTICLDSISEIAEVLLEDAKKKNKDPRKAYGEMQDGILSLMKAFRDIPEKNVYFSAKQAIVKDGTTGAMFFGPSMPGQATAPQMPYLFDEVFQLTVFNDPATQTEYRALRCKKDNQYQAKDRSGMLDAWEPADLNHVFNKIRS